MDAHEVVLNVADRVSQSKPTRMRLCDMTDEDILLKMTGADETDIEEKTKRKREDEEAEEVADEVKAMLVASMQSRIKRRRTEMEEAGKSEWMVRNMEDELRQSVNSIIAEINNLGVAPRDFPPEIWTIIANALQIRFVPRLALISRTARGVVMTYVTNFEKDNRIQWNPNGPVRQAHAHYLFGSPFWHMFFEEEPLQIKVAILASKYKLVPPKLRGRLFSSYPPDNVLNAFKSVYLPYGRLSEFDAPVNPYALLNILWPGATAIELLVWNDSDSQELHSMYIFITIPHVFVGVLESLEELMEGIHLAYEVIDRENYFESPATSSVTSIYRGNQLVMPKLVLGLEGSQAFEVYVDDKPVFSYQFFEKFKNLLRNYATEWRDEMLVGELYIRSAAKSFMNDVDTVEEFVEDFQLGPTHVMNILDEYFVTGGVPIKMRQENGEFPFLK